MRRRNLFVFLCASILINVPSKSQTTAYTKTVVNIPNAGWELKGDLLLVNSRNPKTAVVLMLNKANGDRNAYNALAEQLAQLNISSLRLDLRGHGQSTNKGKFIPFDSVNNSTLDLDNGYTDVVAAHKYLLSLKTIDTNRIAVIGASYSGEEMMMAARSFKYADLYIALSPGSFSEESMSTIEHFKKPTLFIKSVEERSMKDFEKDVFAKSKKAQLFVVAGKMHATDILAAYPNINSLIASWCKTNL